MIGNALSQALRKPVKIIGVDGNSVIFETGEDMTWMATFSMDGGSIMVKEAYQSEAYYVVYAGCDSAPPSMMVKDPEEKDAEEPEGIRDAEDSMVLGLLPILLWHGPRRLVVQVCTHMVAVIFPATRTRGTWKHSSVTTGMPTSMYTITTWLV